MVLKPQIRVKKGHKQSPHTPEVTAFLEGIIQVRSAFILVFLLPSVLDIDPICSAHR